MSKFKECKEGILLSIKVIPRASKNAIMGWENDELKVRLNAVPEKGEANEELIDFLAKTWKLPKTAISLHSGKRNRHKKILITGLNAQDVVALLE